MIPIATPIPQRATQRKLKNAAKSTAVFGGSELVYITGATALAVSWKPLINSNAQTRKRQIPRRISSSIESR